MKWIPVPDNEPETINKALDQIYGLINLQESKIKTIEKAQEVSTQKAVTITEAEEIEAEKEEEIITDEPTPSMAGFTPTVNALLFGRALRVMWSDWSGYGGDDVIDYAIYCSTEATCTINETNLVAENVKSSPYTIRDLSRGITYDVRIRPRGNNGYGEASD